jgi:DNA repair photolyase
MPSNPSKTPNKGRGAPSRPDPRFMEFSREAIDDGWTEQERLPLRTEVQIDKSRTILTYNKSPDVPFDRSINPYRGCEHGCVYCFARPSHAYLDLSPGLDFESRLFVKPEAGSLLANELAKPGYKPAPIALGVNTDAWQPVERKYGITRELLQVLKEFSHPVSMITKSALIERDIDILAPMAEQGLVQVMISVTTLDRELSRLMEPRAAAPHRRLQTIRTLRAAGIPVGVLFAPVIPMLNDNEMETILAAVAEAGATTAGYVMLRLPHEVKDLFQQWLEQHYPLKAEHVLNRVRDLRGGRLNSTEFGERMTGSGEYANLIEQRFRLACKNKGLSREGGELRCDVFRVPVRAGDQMALFGSET